MNRNLYCTFTALTMCSGLLFSASGAGKELATHTVASTAHTKRAAASELAWMPVYYGYCEAAYQNGRWKLNGECVSHTYNGFCDIKPSSDCPTGKRVRNLSSTSCGGLGSAEIDLARTCHF